MNILIVDDDRFVIEALKSGIDWEALGYTTVFTATNMQGAQAILSQNTIHLLLSDIDMPHGSGLELLSWIREQHNELPVIFLTNYPDFHYAQKALSLKSFHYFLKPIEFDKLTAIIREATQQIGQRSTQLEKNRKHFWSSYTEKEFSYKPEVLAHYIEQLHLPYTADDVFLPVLFNFFPHYLTPENELESYLGTPAHQNDYIKVTFAANFEDVFSTDDIFMESGAGPSRYMAIFKLSGGEIPAPLLPDCERFMDSVLSQTQCSVNCLVGIPSTLEYFRPNFEKLNALAMNCLNVQQLVLQSKYHRKDQECTPVDTNLLEVYLNNEQFSSFLDYADNYLHKLSDAGGLSYQAIAGFQTDIVQIVFAFLKSKGILAHNLFHTENYQVLAENARNSLYDMELFLRYVLFVAKDYLAFSSSGKSVAKSIQEHIDLHYAETFDRSSLTDILYLDPDYASKLFKKEFGISLGNYIIQKRIEVAKELLLTTNLPINTVSDNVGYGNYSYFIRLFKKVTKMTPVEFRNQGQPS